MIFSAVLEDLDRGEYLYRRSWWQDQEKDKPFKVNIRRSLQTKELILLDSHLGTTKYLLDAEDIFANDWEVEQE